MKDLDQDFLPLAGLARKQLTRRTFLAGAATATATATTAIAVNYVYDYRLVFDRVPRTDSLTIRQDRRKVANPKSEDQAFGDWKLGEGGSWTIPAAAFGPNASFRLNKIGPGSGRYKLFVTRPEYGRNSSRSLYFEFTAGTFEPYAIAMWTDLWSLTAGPNKTEAFSLGRRPSERNRDLERKATPVPFSAFANGERQSNLYQWVANGRIASTFQLIFNGLLDTRATNNQHGVFLSFSPECVWRVADSAFEFGKADAPPVEITAFEGEVALKEFRFAWCKGLSTRDELGSLTVADEPEEDDGAVLLGTGTPQAGANDIVLALEERSATLTHLAEDQHKHRRLFVQAGYSPEARRAVSTKGQMETQLALTGQWLLRLDRATGENGDPPAETFDISESEPLEGVLRQRLALSRSSLGKLDSAKLKTETFFDGDFVSDKAFLSQTPVGPLLVSGVLPEMGLEKKGDTDAAQPQVTRNPALSFADALTPRRGAAVRLVASRRAVDQPVRLRWFEANLHLQEVFRRLDGSDFSRLTFAPTSLIVIYSEDDAPPSGYASFVNLKDGGGPRAQIDLDRARLVAGGAGNLIHLTFRFQRMALALDAGSATIAPLADVCRVTRLDPYDDGTLMDGWPENAVAVHRSHVQMTPSEPDGTRRALRDDRAILVVEFPPQHVMEQAFFQLDPGSPQAMIFASEKDAEFPSEENRLPGQTPVNLTRPQEVLAALEARDEAGNPPTPKLRKKLREEMLAHYRSKAPEPGTALERARKRFDVLETAYRAAVGQLTGAPNHLPVDQTVYLGPFGLDADAMGVLRRTWAEIVGGQAQQIANDMIERARSAAGGAWAKAKGRFEAGKGRPVDQLITRHAQSFEGAQALAVAVAGAQADFRRFRTFYREAMIDLFLMATPKELEGALKEAWGKLSDAERTLIAPKALSAEETEFVWLLEKTGTEWPGADASGLLKKRFEFLFGVYAQDLSGNDSLDSLAEARLARPSRLAFHVNCQDRQSLLRSRVPELGRASPSDPEAKGSVDDEKRRFGVHALDFNLQDLTRWSGFEMSVTRRAQSLTAPDLAGRVDALSRRQIDDGGGAILDALGFPSGKHLSSAEWNAYLIGALQTPPTPLETAIEIPSRLSLSPDQGAVFLAPQLLDPTLRPDPDMQKLWAARLHSETGPAAIRAVHSPDLRPQVFAQHHNDWKSGKIVPGLAPPPRGPLAPWLLERFDGNTEPGDPWDYAQGHVSEVDDLKTENDVNEALCIKIAERELTGQDRLPLPRLVDWLCERRARRAGAKQALKFRSALDAAVRHELVLLSSAHGMRVVARRNRQGQLLGDSQFLADPRHQLYDLQDGSAIYKPQAFEVEELELTSLGGSYRAMASFEPPAGAKTLDGKPLFPALSVERYQHWVVLGRDIFVEVLFKGFLLPFGHRASLVQVTERRYMRDPSGNITAYLVQRMYIQRGLKTVRFPGLGQPYQGRMIPFQNVSILSERSPDIVNPYDDPAADSGKIGAGGWLRLDDGLVGTAFWPRTAKSAAANVRFELQLDDKFSTLPLLFVDNTAANDRDTLRFICEEYYNKALPNPHRDDSVAKGEGRNRPIDPAVHLSTLQLGGGKLRYAEEEKAGSCSLDTESICIFLTGQDGRAGRRVVQDGSTATDPIKVAGSQFILDNYDFSPVLQGVDRIPAYPAMETSRLYLRQNERLTGRRQELVRAGFDAQYVMHGLPGVPNGPEGTRLPVQGNLSEIFLSLIDMPSQDMGTKGDQSGGVMRPATDLVALSRLNGPVGVAGKGGRDPLSYALGERQVFHNTADLFDAAIAAPVPAPEGALPSVAAVPTGGLLAPASAGVSQFGEVVEDARAIYEKYFSDDAKLLGLISVRELVMLVLQLNGDPELLDPRTGMPKLNELIRYGGGQAQKAVADAADQVEDSAAAGVNYVRVQIVEPLDATLVEVLEIWQETDTRIRSEQQDLGGLVTVVGLDQLLPGLYDALQNLHGAVQEALVETDEILFALSLGAAFEAGRRLIDTVGRILADIDEIVADSVGGQVRGIIDQFTPFLDGLEDTLKALARVVLVEVLTPTLGGSLAETLAKAIVEGGGKDIDIAKESSKWFSQYIIAEEDEDASFVAFPTAPLEGLNWAQGTMASGRPMADVVLECLTPTNAEVRDEVIQPLFEALMNVDARDGALAAAKGNLTNLQTRRMQMVLDGLEAAPGPFCDDNITALPTSISEARLRIETYRRFLEDPEEDARELLEATTDRAVDILFQMFRREIDLILSAQNHLKSAGRAVRAGSLLQAAQSVMTFVELFNGPLFEADTIRDKWASAIETLTSPVRLTVTHTAGNRLGLFDPEQLEQKPSSPCTYDSTTGIASEYAVVEANYGLNLSTRIYAAYDAMSDSKVKAEEAQTAYEAFRGDADIQKILEEAPTNVPSVTTDKIDKFLANTSSAIDRAVRALDKLRALTGQTYCDLVNDSLSADALIKDFDIAMDALKSTGDVTLASRLPEKIEALMRSRQRLISTMMVRLRATGTELRTFFEDENVQTLIALGAAGLLVEATGVKNVVKDLALEAEALFQELQTRCEELEEVLEKFLYRTVQKLEVYMGFVIEMNDDLISLAETSLDHINDLIKPFTISRRGNVAELRQVQPYLGGLRRDINRLLDAKEAAGSVQVTINEIQGLTETLGNRRVPLLEFIAPEVSGPDLEEDFVRVLRLLQAKIEGMIDDLIDAARDRLRREVEAVLKTLDAPVRAVIGRGIPFGSSTFTLITAYEQIKKVRDDFYVRLDANTASQALAIRFLVPELGKSRDDLGLGLPGGPQNTDRLAADLAALRMLRGDGSEPISNNVNRAFLRAFLEEWSTQASTPHVIGSQVLEVIKTALRGEVLKLLPLDQIRDEIEDRILEMVPNQITQSFDFKTNLPNGIEDLTAGIFVPGPGAKLHVGMNIDIDLLDAPQVEFKAFGALGAFDIKLVGQFLDALTLHFDGARFTMNSGAQRRFDVEFRDFTIGRDLEFVADLAEMLNPGGSGPYVVPARGFPGIEAGYGLNIGTFMIGNMSVFNVSLNAAAILPFDSNPTRFRASLSRRDSPFTLSYAPYGGSGFFALEADANGIVGFEASFEFGGAGAFAIGPLTGQGRAMAGFYIRQTKIGGRRMTELAATVFVGGSANIWIFSFGASLYVRLGMVDGNMNGLAIFTYSFSIGIKDFDFTIEWRKQETKGFSGEQASFSDPLNPTRFADVQGGRADRLTIGRDTVCQSKNWGQYQKYFDGGLDQKGYLDGFFN